MSSAHVRPVRGRARRHRHLPSAHTGSATVVGFVSGFLHPIGGLDHVLAMVAVGMLAALIGGRALWLVPASFLGAMVIGSALGLPAVRRVGIVASVVVLGAVVALAPGMPVTVAMALAAAFGMFHGHAHGAEMPAAASAVLYGLGFVTATAAPAPHRRGRRSRVGAARRGRAAPRRRRRRRGPRPRSPRPDTLSSFRGLAGRARNPRRGARVKASRSRPPRADDRHEAVKRDADGSRPSPQAHLRRDLLGHGCLAALSGVACYAAKGPEAFFASFKTDLELLGLIVPRLGAALLIAASIQVLLPRDKVARWLGDRAGLKGILLATGAGMVTPGGR